MASEGSLRSKAFARYWRAGAVSGLGSYITVFSLQALVVLDLHGGAGEVGWLNAARWLPYLVFGLLVGALVDGRRRLPLMIGTDLAQAALLLTIPLLWWQDALTLPALMLIVVLAGTAAVINGAADMSFLPRMLERRHLQPAHARIDATDAAASTAGPALGGLLVGAVGAPLAVLLDSLTYLYSAFTLRGIRVDEPAPRTGVTVRDLLHEIREGVSWVYRSSGLTTIAVATHVWFVGNAIIGVVLAPYVLVTLGLTAFQFGIAGAAGGLGAVVGAMVTTWLGRRLGTGRTIIACHLTTTAAVVVLAMAAQGAAWAFAAVLLGQALYGLAMGMSNSHEMSYRQLLTPDHLQARTNTTLRSFNRAVAMIAAPIAGMLADTWGNQLMLAVAAVIFALVAVGLSVTPFRTVQAPA